MNIESIQLTPFSVKILRPFKTASGTYNNRNGWYIKLINGNDIGIGEIAPLQDYSPDFEKPITKKIDEISSMLDIEKQDVTEEILQNIFNFYLDDYPSIQFGFEIAYFDLASKMAKIPLSKYWNPNALDEIKINAVGDLKETGQISENNLKLKMTQNSIKESKNILDRIFENNPNIMLRLDFNGKLELQDAVKWCREIREYPIDYIEQPFPSDALEDFCELRFHTNIPIAVDESLTDYQSAVKILHAGAADIFIIKPMISGGFKKSNEIKKLAEDNNIRTIITSTLETKIGLTANLHIAAALEISDPCGISTWKMFGENPFKYSSDDSVKVPDSPGLGISI